MRKQHTHVWRLRSTDYQDSGKPVYLCASEAQAVWGCTPMGSWFTCKSILVPRHSAAGVYPVVTKLADRLPTSPGKKAHTRRHFQATTFLTPRIRRSGKLTGGGARQSGSWAAWEAAPSSELQ